MTWQQIETAPTDGRSIILGVADDEGEWAMDFVFACEHEFDGGDWGMTRNICPYTHWHDIAPPPE